MKRQNLTLNQNFLLRPVEFRESIGILEQDLQQVVFPVHVCNFLFCQSNVEWAVKFSLMTSLL